MGHNGRAHRVGVSFKLRASLFHFSRPIRVKIAVNLGVERNLPSPSICAICYFLDGTHIDRSISDVAGSLASMGEQLLVSPSPASEARCEDKPLRPF